MSLRTRLDGRSEDNNSFTIKNKEGLTIAEVKLVGTTSNTLEVETQAGLHIEKKNGWCSKSKPKEDIIDGLFQHN